MTYEEGILGIPKQLEYKAEIIGAEKIRPFKKIIVLGMGGSRLGADILNMIQPELDIYIHSDFDLPALSKETLAESIIIANSYSGATAETISGANKALEAGLNLVIIAGGGELVNMAQEKTVPYIKIPHDEDLSARMAIGYDLVALSKVLNINSAVLELCSKIDAMKFQSQAEMIAGQLGSGVPLIYTSNHLNELGYLWKVVLNETAKIPAFNNRVPELDHNEIAGFSRANLSLGLHCLMLNDSNDPRISKRMEALVPLLRGKGIPVTPIQLEGASFPEKIISSIILAHWVAVELANKAKIDPSQTSIIEEFKKLTHD